MKNRFSYSQMLSGVMAASLVISHAPLAQAQTPIAPKTSNSSTKTTAAKTFNRALDADLIASVLGNDIKKLRKLLERNTDPNAKGTDYATTSALCSAASGGYLEVARALVEAGANLEGGDAFGNVPLMVAALNNRAEVIRFLLQRGASIEGNRSDGLTPLKTAATLGKNEALRALIAAGADVNTQKGGSLSPLMAAALMGNVETVRALIANGASVNARLATNETALFYGAKYTGTGNLEIVKMLVEAGADVSVKNDSGKFAHEIAAANKLYVIESYLVDIYNRDNDLFNVTAKASREMKTATMSTRLANWQLMKDELAKGANPRFANDDGFTTLINLVSTLSALLVTLNDDDVTMKAIMARSDLNAQIKKDGLTALHIAVDNKNARLVGWLIKAGANVNIQSRKNETPLDWALEDESDDILASLQNAGAKTYAQLQNPNASVPPPSTPVAPPTVPATPVVIKPIEAAPPANTIAKSPLDKINMEGYDQGVTVLMQAARDGKVAEVERLLKEGATVDIVGPENGHTALFFAAFGNSPASMKVLLKAGANINFLNHNGETPLVAASFRSAAATVRFLVEAGADLKYLDAAIENAKRGNNVAVVEYLTALKATGATGSTPPAAKPGNTSTTDLIKLLQQKTFDAHGAEALLKSGADSNVFDSGGKTPLMCAAESGTVEAVKWLLTQKIVIDAADKNGMTALMYGAGRDNDDTAWNVVAALLDANANWKMKNKDGKTAHDLALAKSNDWTATVLEIEMGT